MDQDITSPHAIIEAQFLGKCLQNDGTPNDNAVATETVQDADFSNETLRAMWRAVKDEWDKHGVVQLDRIMSSLRKAFPVSGPSAAWLYEVYEGGLVGLPILELASMVAKNGAARSVEVATERVIADGASQEPLLEALRVAQERLKSLQSGVHHVTSTARDLADLFSEDEGPPPEELVERLITRPGVVICYGASGSGKSYALMAGFLDIVGGGGCFVGAEGLQLRPRTTKFGDEPDRVLWVYGSEDPERRIRHRARELWESGPHRDKQLPRGQFLIASPGPICLGTAEGLRWLRREIEKSRATVVVLDTVQSLTSASLDTSDGIQVARWMVELHRLRDKFGAVIVPVCHTSKTSGDPKTARGKADSLLGSQAWRALSDGLVMIDAPDGDASRCVLRLLKGKDIDNPIPPLDIEMNGQTKRFTPAIEDDQQDGTAPTATSRPSARTGRPPSISLEIVLELLQKLPNGVPMVHDPEIHPCSKTSWHRVRDDIRKACLQLGHPLVNGHLVWGAETGTESGTTSGPESSCGTTPTPRPETPCTPP